MKAWPSGLYNIDGTYIDVYLVMTQGVYIHSQCGDSNCDGGDDDPISIHGGNDLIMITGVYADYDPASD